MTKKIIILGAMQMHVPLIEYAKKLGFYTITLDYTPDAPGHKISDEISLISTTDLDAVLRYSKEKNIDYIITFNSDPAAYTAAYVSEKLGLRGNSPKSVAIMSDKGLFRNYLMNNGFNVPKFTVIDTNKSDYISNLRMYKYPVIVKPIDSSGSKGVSKIEANEPVFNAVNLARSFSKTKKVIIEEFIETDYCQLHGDGFVFDYEIKQIFLGDHHFNTDINGLVPFSTTFPSKTPDYLIDKVKKEVSKFIKSVGFEFGGINIEARICKRTNKVFLIEIGARNGGNFTYEVIENFTGFSFIQSFFNALDFKYSENNNNGEYLESAYLIIHSEVDGYLKSIKYNNEIENICIRKVLYKNKNDTINKFTGSNTAIGILIVGSKEKGKINLIVDKFKDYFNVELFDIVS